MEWHHEFPDEPVVLYSEVNEVGAETRKVDVYVDGRMDYAEASRSIGAIKLSELRMPVEEIAAQPELAPIAISAEVFENIWQRATGDGASLR